MKNINEVQVLNNVRLSQAQKLVLTKLMLPNQTPLTSYEQTSNGKNMVANRDILVQLGMVQVGENQAQITDKGKAALQNENLIDESGQLTETGQQYAYAKDLADVEKIADQERVEPTDVPVEPAKSVPREPQQPTQVPAQNPDGQPFPESWTMIADMQNDLNQKEFMGKQSKKS